MPSLHDATVSCWRNGVSSKSRLTSHACTCKPLRHGCIYSFIVLFYCYELSFKIEILVHFWRGCTALRKRSEIGCMHITNGIKNSIIVARTFKIVQILKEKEINLKCTFPDWYSLCSGLIDIATIHWKSSNMFFSHQSDILLSGWKWSIKYWLYLSFFRSIICDFSSMLQTKQTSWIHIPILWLYYISYKYIVWIEELYIWTH